MNVTPDTMITAGVALFGSISVYAGARLMANNENKKVKNSEFRMFREAYNDRIAELEKRFKENDTKLTKVESLLRQALRHILDLRVDMRTQGVNPTHTAPPELESLLWSYDPAAAAAPPVPPSGPAQGE